jgi:RHS repeat-associated protein
MNRARSGGFEVEYRFTGKELDDENDLHYFGARYYDAMVGRFVSVDPLYLERSSSGGNLLESNNLYSYSASNPIRFIDPTGMSFISSTKEVVKQGYNDAKGTVKQEYNEAKDWMKREYNKTKTKVNENISKLKHRVKNMYIYAKNGPDPNDTCGTIFLWKIPDYPLGLDFRHAGYVHDGKDPNQPGYKPGSNKNMADLYFFINAVQDNPDHPYKAAMVGGLYVSVLHSLGGPAYIMSQFGHEKASGW